MRAAYRGHQLCAAPGSQTFACRVYPSSHPSSHIAHFSRQDPVKFPTNISPEFKSFLKGLLNKRPNER